MLSVLLVPNHSQICHDAPALRGRNISSTCGMACASKLQAASGLPDPDKPRTSDPPNSAFMSSAPPNIFDNNWASPKRSSEPTRTYADITRPYSRPNQMIRMCDVSTLIYDSDPKQNCLLYARYVMSALAVKEEAKSTLLVDSAVLLNCMPPVLLKCVM